MGALGLCRSLGLAVAGIALGLSPAAFPAVQISLVPNSTPLGITLVDVTSAFGGGGGGGAELYYRRLGDTDGKPLYTLDQDGNGGKSTCVAACAEEFPPYLVAKEAVAFGPWSIIRRVDGARQWAYRGRLFTVTRASIRFPRVLGRMAMPLPTPSPRLCSTL